MVELIKKLTTAFGVSGFEKEVAEIVEKELANITDIKKDNLGNIYCDMSTDNNLPKIVLIAHMDEIGFMVSDILETGHLKLQPIGGWNPYTLQSSKVVIKTNNGRKVMGVIGSIPVHFLKSSGNGIMDISDIFVDIGAVSRENVINDFNVRLGDPVVPYTDFHFIKKTERIFAKAFDDRIGVAAMVQTAKNVSILHSINAMFIGSVQEEVGARGSNVVANNINANVAIVLEGAPADDFPNFATKYQTVSGNGAHIRLFDPSMIAKKELANFIIHLAEKNNIKYQLAVRRSGGTDGRNMQTAFWGIPTIVLGVPVRYAHSHNGVIALEDFENLVKLLTLFITEFDNEVLKKVF